MKQTLAIARKELRAYFLSPVALIFLATFLFVTLFSFFWVDTFFSRKVADVRPLFHWLPVLLIFLVGALTMRLWSEEQRSGTLEVLLTLPVPSHRLVAGKFLAGLVLVAIALVLTLGLPITVSRLGELDWGPVVGGYLAALLLAAAYLAIGLCLSSVTDNPIVALISTVVACGLLYLVGSDTVTSFAGIGWAELLRSVGTGSRFESIQRGVIDLRDLVYYGSLTGGFLFLNVVLLEAKRWSRGARTRGMRRGAVLATALVLVNLLALNALVSPVRAARIDLTARKEYSISKVTEKLLEGLDAPLLIRGYFSEKTHPLLAPLVPRIRDLIREYGLVGGRNVRTEFVDPRQDPALEKEANEDYGIKSVPFQSADRHETAVVNSYFSVLVKFGDKYETISFEDLIEVKVTGLRDIEVKLRNLEYDLTRAIKKVVYGFQPLEEVFTRAPEAVTLTAFLTEKTLPKPYAELPKRLDKVALDLKKRSGGKLVFKKVDPSGEGKDQLRHDIYRRYGFRPMATSLLSEETFYCHLLVTLGKKADRILPSAEMSEADLRQEITASLKRLTPGFLKTIGLLAPEPEQPPPNPMMRRRPQQQGNYTMLKAKLQESYTVRDIDLKDGRVPGEVDVLLLVQPTSLDEKQRYAVDQYLMRGGTVVIFSGAFSLDPTSRMGLSIKKVASGLEELLAAWGVKIDARMVLDPQNEAFPIPVERNVMGLTVRELQLVPYPFFVDVRPGAMAEGNPIVAGLPQVTLQWASPIELVEKKGVQTTVLFRSSEGSWTQDSTEVQPNFERFPGKGFGPQGETKARPLGALATGTFTSAFADKPSPLFAEDKDRPPAAGGAKKGDASSRTVKSSPAAARLVVVGTSDFASDVILNLSRQTGSDNFANSLQLVQNLMDYAVADVDLLSIRSRGTFARTLKPMEESARSTWELANYAFVAVGLVVIVVVTLLKRRRQRPMELVPPPTRSAGKA
jgi:ABC-2 type transport system permease protein